MRHIAVVAFIALGACGERVEATPDRAAHRTRLSLPAAPRVTSCAEIVYGQKVVVEGTLTIDVIPTPKGTRPVWIDLADGTSIFRAAEPGNEDLALEGKEIYAIGILGRRLGGASSTASACSEDPTRWLSVITQPTLIERPLASVLRTGRPLPEIVSTRGAMRKALGKWAAIVGKLQYVNPPESLLLGSALVRLGDGALVRVAPADAAAWKPHVGRTVTVVARPQRETEVYHWSVWARDLAPEYVVESRFALCAGVDPRCGMLP